jgi:DNA (cytosine-5)-methyltransferase 1
VATTTAPNHNPANIVHTGTGPRRSRPARFGYDSDITICDEFSGVGGSTEGARRVKYTRPVSAANHDADAVKAHELNHPDVKHYQADVTKLAPEDMPPSVCYLASPVCPPFTGANGMRVDFDRASAQQDLFGNEAQPDDDPKRAQRRAAYKRARLLMWEPLRYLRAKAAAGTPVLIGVVENVWQARKWAEFDRWRREFHLLGYDTYLLAFDSQHARPVVSPLVPQSRNRMFLAYCHRSVGRRPDFRKWLDPYAHCPRCDTTVHAVKVWKNPHHPVLGEMGCFGPQYIYQCPNGGHGPQEVIPPILPALAAIDPALPGIRIGDRAAHGRKRLEEPTLDRIRAGIRKHWLPLLVPTGGTRRAKGDDGARPLHLVMPSRTTSECDAVAVPPLLIPVEGRAGKKAALASEVLRSQTTRLETAIATLPFLTPLRGGGDKGRSRSVLDPASTVSAGGNHHGLAMLPPLMMRNFTARGDQAQMTRPATDVMRTLTTAGKQTVLTWAESLLVPYYTKADTARPAASETMGTLTTRDRYGVVQMDLLGETGTQRDTLPGWDGELDVNDVLFRMLEPHEIRTAMGFPDTYRTGASAKKTKVRLYGNAVTPAVMECIVSALVECLTGEELEAAPCLL